MPIQIHIGLEPSIILWRKRNSHLILVHSQRNHFTALCQIPDIKTGNERIDAVVVDEESVGSIDSLGCGGKILRGDGALERYLAENKLKESTV